MAVPQAGSKLTLLKYDMLNIPDSGGQNPLLYSQSLARPCLPRGCSEHRCPQVSAPQCKQRCWRCDPRERSWVGEVPNLPLNSAELSSSFQKLISFSLNLNLVIVLRKVFPPTAPAALLRWHRFCPVTILDPVQGEPAAVWPPGRIMWTMKGKMPGNFNTFVKSDLEHPRHTLLFSCLYFSPVKGSIIPPSSVLGWRQSIKSPNEKSF